MGILSLNQVMVGLGYPVASQNTENLSPILAMYRSGDDFVSEVKVGGRKKFLLDIFEKDPSFTLMSSFLSMRPGSLLSRKYQIYPYLGFIREPVKYMLEHLVHNFDSFLPVTTN